MKTIRLIPLMAAFALAFTLTLDAAEKPLFNADESTLETNFYSLKLELKDEYIPKNTCKMFAGIRMRDVASFR